ncbi:unnamed protein product [Symbiodinium sp. KB8]|nr:unnamed protein product [Symbiodinium sp. KB8]
MCQKVLAAFEHMPACADIRLAQEVPPQDLKSTTTFFVMAEPCKAKHGEGQNPPSWTSADLQNRQPTTNIIPPGTSGWSGRQEAWQTSAVEACSAKQERLDLAASLQALKEPPDEDRSENGKVLARQPPLAIPAIMCAVCARHLAIKATPKRFHEAPDRLGGVHSPIGGKYASEAFQHAWLGAKVLRLQVLRSSISASNVDLSLRICWRSDQLIGAEDGSIVQLGPTAVLLGLADWLWSCRGHMTGAVDHSFVQLGPAKANLSGVAKSMNESVEMKQRPFLPKAAPKRPQEVPEGHRMEQEPPPEAKAEIEVLMTRLSGNQGS